SLLLRQGDPPWKRVDNARKRLRQVPRVVGEMNANVKNPPRVLAEVAAEEFESGAEFIEQALPPLATSLSDSARADLDGALGEATAAMRDAASGLRARHDKDSGKIGMGRRLY